MIMSTQAGGMNNHKLEALIAEIGTDVEGQPGFWQFTSSGRRLYCITDETHDRMRIMAPIVDTSTVEEEKLMMCLEANFDRALDARYCTNAGTLWGAFIHPLRSLDAELFRSGCRQVAELATNFGGTYSSGELRFGG